MFNEVNGLPVHILVLHAAVVFVPLLALGAVAYGFVARWRPKIGWAVAFLAVVAPVSTLVSKLSGTELYNNRFSTVKGTGKEILEHHMSYANMAWWFSLALGVLTLIMVALTFRNARALPKVADLVYAVVLLALAAANGYYIYKTGDTGATAAWGSY
ncbi:DUF2231 domain-containing protein [Actinoplanes sp. NPDC051851]|uniref:DUF2231 domain-containing protein n=1 Tax=Actinoplanes sp. NPDC051851 TaxID=3154753 RepID=UPI00341891E2